MEKRNGFITFIAALVPGVGYMYLGLVKKGVEVLVLFLLIDPIFRLLGISYLAKIIQFPLWFFTFFDTFSIAKNIDKGESIQDTDFIFKKYTENGLYKNSGIGSNNIWVISAWLLILVGSLALLNKIFYTNDLYNLIRSYASTYFLPVLLILCGVYLLYKNKK